MKKMLKRGTARLVCLVVDQEFRLLHCGQDKSLWPGSFGLANPEILCRALLMRELRRRFALSE